MVKRQRADRKGPPSAFLCALSCALCALALPGCQILGFGGALVENYRRNSTKKVAPEYTGLTGKRWAVIVSADRGIQADYSDIVPILTARIAGRLADPAQQQQIAAAGYIPPDRILQFQYENPSWVALPYGELAKRLGVDRLLIVEVIEYRLNDPGNQYLWEGIATGTLSVVEADGRMPDEPSLQKTIRVTFPDKSGMGPQDVTMQAVASVLVSRFVDRTSWLFYTHDEPYYPKY